MKWFVEVVEFDSGQVVQRIGPSSSQNTATKVERGVLINMNRDNYYTRLAGEAE